MRITWGSTRLVVLTKTRAIKFGLFFRPFYPLMRVCTNLRKGGVERLWDKFKAERNGGLSVIRKIHYLLFLIFPAGIAANRLEHALYSTHPHLPIARIFALRFGGFVLVMERGQLSAIQEWRRFLASLEVEETDVRNIFAHFHVLRCGDCLKIVDYGRAEEVERLLELFSIVASGPLKKQILAAGAVQVF